MDWTMLNSSRILLLNISCCVSIEFLHAIAKYDGIIKNWQPYCFDVVISENSTEPQEPQWIFCSFYAKFTYGIKN